MGNKSHFFRQSSGGGYNTIIGGVGATINTDVLLADKLQVEVNIIQDFEVIDNDIYCKITSEYFIPDSCFSNNTEITSYIDLDGMVYSTEQNKGVGNYAFYNTTSLIEASFPSVLYLGFKVFQNSSIEKLECENVNVLGYQAFDNADNIENLSFPYVTVIDTRTMANMESLNSVYLPLAKSFNGSECISYNKSLEFIELPLMELTPTDSIQFAYSRTKHISLPKTKNFRRDNFYQNIYTEVLNLPSLENFDSEPPAPNENLYGFPQNLTINLPIALETTPNTVVREWIDLMVSLKNATINYV